MKGMIMKRIIIAAAVLLLALHSDSRENRKGGKTMKGYVELTETSSIVDNSSSANAVWQKIPCQKCCGRGFIVEDIYNPKKNSSVKVIRPCEACGGKGTVGVKKDIQR